MIRAHHHSAGARHRPPKDIPAEVLAPTVLEVDVRPVKSTGGLSNDTNSGVQSVVVPDREGLGRSRGGVTTKIHLVADSRCRPIARVTTAGQRHDSVAFSAVMADISISRGCGGRPRTGPDRVLAGKAYFSKKIRNALRRRGIRATIPEPSTQIAGRLSRGSRGGRPPNSTWRFTRTAHC